MTDKVERGLSIRPPFAPAIFIGGKDVENRKQKTNIRGRIYIQQSLKDDGLAAHGRVIARMRQAGLLNKKTEARFFELCEAKGCIIGHVEIVDCVFDGSASAWGTRDHWHWVLRNPVLLPQPIPHKGALGFWKVKL